MVATTKVFQTNKSQAVRLPKAVAFPSDVSEVSITAVGVTRVIAPVNQSWDFWFDSATISDDFINEREQPEMQSRESLDD